MKRNWRSTYREFISDTRGQQGLENSVMVGLVFSSIVALVTAFLLWSPSAIRGKKEKSVKNTDS